MKDQRTATALVLVETGSKYETKDKNGNFVPQKITVNDLKIIERNGKPPFVKGLSWEARALGKSNRP